MARKVKSGPSDADAHKKRAREEDADPGLIQSGDLQGLRDTPEAESESVRELAAEGQAFEAMVVNSIENSQAADAGEVKTREAPEDDVPPEYVDQPPDEPKEK
jgi:hypothetical protein